MIEAFTTIVGMLIAAFVIITIAGPFLPTRDQRKIRKSSKQLERMTEIMKEVKAGANGNDFATELWSIYIEAEVEYTSHLAFLLAKKYSINGSIEAEVAKLIQPFSPKK